MRPIRWRASASRETSEEDFPFTFQNGPESIDMVRRNADLQADRMSATIMATLDPHVELSGFAAYLGSERGVPGVVAGPYSASQAKQTDRTVLVQASATDVPAPWMSWETRVQGQYGYQRYRDPDLAIGYVPVNNYTVGREFHGESHTAIEAGHGLKLYAGMDMALVGGEGNAYRSNVTRNAWGAAVAAEQIVAGSPETFILRVFPALRYDKVSTVGDAWSPQLGILLQQPVTMPLLFRDASVRLRGMVSRNFRAPTFNELFYAGGGGIGNPDLRPEHSTGYEAGFGWSGRWWAEHHLDITGFVTAMKDRIVWIPATGGNVTPRNLRSVDARGLEVQYVMIADGIRFDLNYTRQRTLKMSEDYPGDPNTHVPVIYAPEETAGMQCMWSCVPGVRWISAVDVSGTYAFVGHRYITEDAHDFLPAYQVLGAGVGMHLDLGQIRTHVKLQVENLLDASYEVMAGYPMPPRTLRVSCDIAY